jgi:hypothetical protein
MHCKFLYQVEVWSVSRHGRFCTDIKVPGYRSIVFAPYTRNWYLLNLSVCSRSFWVNPCLVSDTTCHRTSYLFFSLLNMHVWSPVMSFGIMLYCADFCTQLTTLKSPHNKQLDRFCCHLVLMSRSCAGGELCCELTEVEWTDRSCWWPQVKYICDILM